MNYRLEQWLGGKLAIWVDAMRRHAVVVVALALASIPLLSVYAARNLGVNASMDQMISPDLPHRVLEREYQKKFPVLAENIVVVIDAPTPERAHEASVALAARMAAAPEHFTNVYLPGGAFFEEHAFLYMSIEELEAFADRLAEVQPYLAGLAEDGTLRGLASLLGRGVSAVRDGEVAGDELAPMFARFSAAVRALRGGETYQVSWAEVVGGDDMALVSRRRFILTQPKVDFANILAAERPIRAVRGFAAELGLDEASGVRVRMTGDVVLSYEEMLLVQRQTRLAGLASFMVVTALLFVALRSPRLVLATALTLIAGLVWTTAFAVAAIGHLNVISVSFAVLSIGLGVDFGIHFCMRYRELIVHGSCHVEALSKAAQDVGTSLLLCAATTAIGFYAFVPTDFAGVAELGLISGTGVFISLFASVTLLPAAISLGLRSPVASPASPRTTGGATRTPLPMRHPRAVSSLALMLAVVAVLVLPEVRFEGNPLSLRDPSAESVRTFEDLLSSGDGSPWDVSVLTPNAEAARELAERMRQLPEVSRAVTMADFVPPDQDDKLGIMEDVSMFLAPPPAADGSTKRPTLEEQLQALAKFQSELDKLVHSNADEELIVSARDLHDAMAALLSDIRGQNPHQRKQTVDALESSLLGTLPSQLESLAEALAASPISLERLPQDLVERMVSDSGTMRVQISPAEDLNDDAATARFVEAIRTVSMEVTGGAVGVYEAKRAVVGAFQQALSVAVVVIAVLLLFIWRTVGDTMLIMVPLAWAGILTAAATVLFNIPFNFADVIALPLLLGIGVDTGIHLVERWRLGDDSSMHLLETSTAQAVVFSALTTIGSFGTLAFATHRGMASMGKLLALGLALTVICNLLVLPALMELRSRATANSRD